jgi:hypothetical protein
MNKRQISNLCDTKEGRKKLALLMVEPIKRHMECFAMMLGLGDPFAQYWIIGGEGKLVPWQPYKHGYSWDYKQTWKDKDGVSKNVLLTAEQSNVCELRRINKRCSSYG